MSEITIVGSERLGQAMQAAIAIAQPTASCRTVEQVRPEDSGFCVLTLDVPPELDFAGQKVFAACRQVDSLRQWVTAQTGYRSGPGTYWLPIVNTAKGPLYAEAIAQSADSYHQPLHLNDQQRQPLYQLGFSLLQYLQAPPAVYLLAFGYADRDLLFDRLWPFPAEPALASLNVQQPDLFTCHWRCLTNQPILDLLIPSQQQWQSVG
jgi:hypothetical protein